MLVAILFLPPRLEGHQDFATEFFCPDSKKGTKCFQNKFSGIWCFLCFSGYSFAPAAKKNSAHKIQN
ncbi:MAG: hypothetical protein DA408_18620 [Bacteroidetes bacterium]|nr:MAG: hypothetical protein C7N36_15695 [Bacteroidota bacterium]PTM09332.1 MAG: hypothetical protein DA408_18620 [Bacteroidota bacterium]